MVEALSGVVPQSGLSFQEESLTPMYPRNAGIWTVYIGPKLRQPPPYRGQEYGDLDYVLAVTRRGYAVG